MTEKRCVTQLDNSRGFTLLEILVAVAIFAIISMAAYTTLTTLLKNQQQTEAKIERLQEVQRAISLLERDMWQLAERRARDELGDAKAALLGQSAGPGKDGWLEWTRDGWRNPTGFARSHLQRVRYHVSDGELMRDTWLYVDRAPQVKPLSQPVLSGVRTWELRFLINDEVHDHWPLEGTRDKLPRALEITLELEDYGVIKRLFALSKKEQAPSEEEATP